MTSEKAGLTGVLNMSNADVNTLQSLSPYFTPMVSPWLTLGVGAAMGYDSQRRAMQDQRRAVELNATMAELAPYTGMRPEQVSFQEPDLAGNLLGGLSTAQGVAGSINQFSPIYNAQKLAAEEAAQKQADATLAQENGQILGLRQGPLSGNAYDASFEAPTPAPEDLSAQFYRPPFAHSDTVLTQNMPEYRGQFLSPYYYMEPSSRQMAQDPYRNPRFVGPPTRDQVPPLPVFLGE